MISAAKEIIRDVQARHTELQASALWFNFGRALGRLEEADRAMKNLPSLD